METQSKKKKKKKKKKEEKTQLARQQAQHSSPHAQTVRCLGNNFRDFHRVVGHAARRRPRRERKRFEESPFEEVRERERGHWRCVERGAVRKREREADLAAGENRTADAAAARASAAGGNRTAAVPRPRPRLRLAEAERELDRRCLRVGVRAQRRRAQRRQCGAPLEFQACAYLPERHSTKHMGNWNVQNRRNKIQIAD